MKKHAFWLVLAVMASRMVSGQDLPRGQIVDDVQCADAASQHYALYLPSNFTPARHWPVIFGFDAGGRGRRAVERYQAAAEKYGYIVAGSNNSRNGSWEVSLDAAAAMTADINKRFPVDAKRTYTAGMSGGARVAMMLALNSRSIAGVLASSAGFPGEFQQTVRFPVFGSMGTDDFNHYEMHQLDRDLKSPHRVEMFDGGHQWLPVEMATDGVEWMEIQAMRSGLRPRDQKLVDEIFAKRMARAEVQKSSLDRMRELKSIVADFKVFKDVAKIEQRAAAMERQGDVKKGLAAEREEDENERRVTAEVFDLRDALTLNSTETWDSLKDCVTMLLGYAKAPEDSANRRVARRVLASLTASSRGIFHPEFEKLLNEVRQTLQPAPQAGGPQ